MNGKNRNYYNEKMLKAIRNIKITEGLNLQGKKKKQIRAIKSFPLADRGMKLFKDFLSYRFQVNKPGKILNDRKGSKTLP